MTLKQKKAKIEIELAEVKAYWAHQDAETTPSQSICIWEEDGVTKIRMATENEPTTSSNSILWWLKHEVPFMVEQEFDVTVTDARNRPVFGGENALYRLEDDRITTTRGGKPPHNTGGNTMKKSELQKKRDAQKEMEKEICELAGFINSRLVSRLEDAKTVLAEEIEGEIVRKREHLQRAVEGSVFAF